MRAYAESPRNLAYIRVTREVTGAKSMPSSVMVVLGLEPRDSASKLGDLIAVPTVCSESGILQF